MSDSEQGLLNYNFEVENHKLDMIKSSTFVEPTLKAYGKLLIGVEYVIELHSNNMKKRLFYCTLCVRECDSQKIVPHMTSHGHLMKYLNAHFPSLMSILNRDKRISGHNDIAYRGEVLTKIAERIQSKYGHGSPSIYDCQEYVNNQEFITCYVKNLYHICEFDFPNFKEILLKDIKIESADLLYDDISSDDDQFVRRNEMRKEQSESSSQPPTINCIRPEEVFGEDRKIFGAAYWFSYYKTSLDIKTKEIERHYKGIKSTPQLVERKRQEIKIAKENICEKLNLSKNMAKKYDEQIAEETRALKRSFSCPEQSTSICDDKGRKEGRKRMRLSESSAEMRQSATSSEPAYEGPLTIVKLFGFLSALETELGILAPRVHKILEEAVGMENNEANSSEKLLLEFANVNFLDTVKEKLKGLLSADLVGPSRKIPVKRAIRNIATIIQEAQKLKMKNAQSSLKPSTSSSGA